MSSTAERLLDYYAFDEQIVEQVAEISARHHGRSYDELTREYNVPKPAVFESLNGSTVGVVDVVPSGEDGYEDVFVYHEAMASPAGPNMIMHVIGLVAARPNTRVIAIGNPGGPGTGAGKLTFSQARKVWKGNLDPTVEPTLAYLVSQGIDEAVHAGYSYGADKVLTTASRSVDYQHEVTSVISMDPATIKPRGLLELGLTFAGTEEHLQPYIDATDSRAYLEAREAAGGLIRYSIGLARVTNFAVAKALSRGGYQKRAEQALSTNPNLDAHIVWGSNSELAIDPLMQEAVTKLQAKFGEDRVRKTVFPGQYHAMCDDIDLHTATILQELEN